MKGEAAMMVRMSLPERVEVMKELQDTVLKVSCEVQDIMRVNFARYNDKDTPLIEGIFTALDRNSKCGVRS